MPFRFRLRTNLLAIPFLMSSLGFLYYALRYQTPQMPRNHGEYIHGREWQLILIASSHCPACNAPGVRPAVIEVANEFDRQVRASGDKPTTLGVITDDDQRAAFKYAESLGQFDELQLGRNWLNQSVIRYMLRDAVGLGATPTVLIVTRVIDFTNQGNYRIGPDSVVVRLVGPSEIIDFASWLKGRLSGPPGLSDQVIDSNMTTPGPL